ncbi:MAG: DUF1573 domain-containing protein [Bacteroidia bacterium]
MQKAVSVIGISVLLVACQTTVPTPSAKTFSDGNPEPKVTSQPVAVGQIKFEKEEHDFGKIKEGEKVQYRFKFKNTGSAPVRITDVKPSCGCTSPEWTKDVVPPGGEGYVEVIFDSQGRQGTQNKSVTVLAEADPPTYILRFTGEVIR